MEYDNKNNKFCSNSAIVQKVTIHTVSSCTDQYQYKWVRTKIPQFFSYSFFYLLFNR